MFVVPLLIGAGLASLAHHVWWKNELRMRELEAKVAAANAAK